MSRARHRSARSSDSVRAPVATRKKLASQHERAIADEQRFERFFGSSGSRGSVREVQMVRFYAAGNGLSSLPKSSSATASARPFTLQGLSRNASSSHNVTFSLNN